MFCLFKLSIFLSLSVSVYWSDVSSDEGQTKDLEMWKFVLLKVLYHFASASNLFIYFRRRYNQQVIQNLNQVLRLRGKVVRTVENIIFLEKCLDSFVMPSRIRHRVSRTRLKRPGRFEWAFLLDEIDQRKDFVSRTRQDYRRLLPGTLRELTFFF